MIRLRLTLALIAISVLPSCAHVQPVVDAGKACVSQADADAAKNIIPAVSGALGCAVTDVSAIPACVATGLEELAARYGESLLSCALADIANTFGAGPAEALKQRRAKAYLDSKKLSLLQGGGTAPRGPHKPEKLVQLQPLQPTEKRAESGRSPTGGPARSPGLPG